MIEIHIKQYQRYIIDELINCCGHIGIKKRMNVQNSFHRRQIG